MLQRVLIVSAINCIILISLLFGNILNSQVYELEVERQKNERYLSSQVDKNLNIIRDQIFYSYLNLTIKSIALKNDLLHGDLSTIESFISETYEETPFSDVIGNGHIVMLDSPREILPLPKSIFSIQKFAKELANMESNRMQFDKQALYVHDLVGFLALPILIDSNKISGLLMMDLNLKKIIDKTLPPIIEEVLTRVSFGGGGNIDNFTFKIAEGSALKDYNQDSQADLLINLNEYYEVDNLNDFKFDKMYERPPLYFHEAKIQDDKIYLMINHKSGNLTAYYEKKYNLIRIRYLIIYLILIFSIIILFYTTYRIRMNIRREHEFSSLISHELKTPLSVIKLGAQNLSEGRVKNSDDVKYYGEMILKESERLQTMVENILHLSTEEGKDSKNRYIKEDIQSMIDELQAKCQYLMEQHSVTMQVSYDTQIKSLKCNRSSFLSAVYNVLQNGISYGASFSEDKILYFNIYEKNQGRRRGLVFNIKDHGPGIKWKYSKMIFKPFYRGKETKKNQLSGSGLGLSLTQRIIKEHHGTITLEKNLIKETSFEIWIPNRIQDEKNITD